MTNDTMKVDWAQPLEVVYDNGDVFTPDESHGNYASWIDGYGDRRRHCFEDDGRSNVGDCFRIRNKPAAAVAPVGGDEEWGDPIEVDGMRPEWLGDDEMCRAGYGASDWYGGMRPADKWPWLPITHIMLKANHPHYRTKTTAEAPLGVLTGVERVERLEALTARLAACDATSDGLALSGCIGDAKALVAEKAPPIDPDLLKAREICAVIAEGMSDDGLATEYRRGDLDDQFEMRSALVGLRSPASDHRSK